MMGPGAESKSLSQYYTWMVEHATLGKPFECFVTEDTARPVIYYKDAIRAALMLFEASKDKIDTVCYNISGVSPARTARELETIIRKYIPQAAITYKPDQAIMRARQDMNVITIDDSRARSEWGWQPLYYDLEKIVVEFIQELKGSH
jgi:nucleoside-diphosphate-sugar epimerase